MLKLSICLRKLTPADAEYIATYLYLNILSMVTYLTLQYQHFVVFIGV